MKIRCGYEITFECPAPTPMLLMLHVHPSRAADLITPDRLNLDRPTNFREYTDGFGNLCSRLVAPEGKLTISSEFLIHDTGLPDPVRHEVKQCAVEDLPDEIVVYLLGSR